MAAATAGDTVKKLIVEVVEARDLQPKDGVGTSSPYVVVDFDGQRKRTETVHRDLNPVWNKVLQFDVSKTTAAAATGTDLAAGEPLEVDVLHDKRVGTSRRNNFLGRVRLDSRQFVRKGEEALMHFPLQKKNFFSWVRGDIGLKIYFADVPVPVPEPPPPPPEQPEAAAPAPPRAEAETAPATDKAEEPAAPPPAADEEAPPPAEPPVDNTENPEIEVGEAVEQAAAENPPPASEEGPDTGLNSAQPPEDDAPPMVELETTPPAPPEPKPILRLTPPAKRADRPPEPMIERSSFDLVEKMQYLFVRVVRARSLPAGARPHVRVSISGRHVSTRPAQKAALFEWDQTFAFPRRDTSADSSLEISVWDLPPDSEIPEVTDGGKHFFGGVCFDTTEVPVRDPPDSPLATQWYRLEGGAARRGDLMLATWIGTQADESYHHALKAEEVRHVNTRSKVYLSPKLWYLRLTVLEAQDLTIAAHLAAAPPPPSRDSPISVKATLGFQSVRTRFAANRNGSPSWNEDLVFVAAEPFGEQRVVLSLEYRHGKEQGLPPVLGSALIPLSTIERRVDDRQVASRWLALDTMPGGKAEKTKGIVFGAGRLHVRACFDGGYHVAEEPAHASSDYRPSARQLWKPPIGTVELGIIGCRGLLPVKTVQGKGCTDAYAVAKYGPKWARTRTVAGTLDPAWNEQYTWPVYDPSTVLTVGVFDDDDSQKGSGAASRPIGRVRIRISTLESGKAYRSSHPLLLLLPTGVKRMGEVELAVRFSRAVSSLDLIHVYGQPMLPPMHHLRPIPPTMREPLRSAAARTVATHLSRADPPLRKEMVMYMLETEAPPRYSMRKVRANWQRIVASLSWAADAARWVGETRTWRNPTSTMLMHAVLVLLVWYPDLIVPAIALHLSAVGVWKYRRRPLGPAAQPWEISAAAAEYGGGAVVEELDEELDPMPSGKGYEVVRARYDRLRAVAGRVQGVLGDVAAHAERVQALVTWRDPRATGIFVAFCFFISAVLFVVPFKIMAVGLGFFCLRHPMFRDRMPPPAINYFRRLPSLSDKFL